MPGPAPKPAGQRRRRNATPATRRLPAAGPGHAPPSWPLHGPGELEAELWDELWHKPQAIVWAEVGWTRTVARYVRWLVAAETLPPADVPAAVLTELRQLEDRLGLTPMAMRRLGWEIDDQAPSEPTSPPSPHGPLPAAFPAGQTEPETPRRSSSARRRVRAVDHG